MTQKPAIPRDLEFYFPFLCPETRLHFSGLFPKTQGQLPFFVPFIRPRPRYFSNLPETCGRSIFRPREKEEVEKRERRQDKKGNQTNRAAVSGRVRDVGGGGWWRQGGGREHSLPDGHRPLPRHHSSLPGLKGRSCLSSAASASATACSLSATAASLTATAVSRQASDSCWRGEDGESIILSVLKIKDGPVQKSEQV